MPIVTIGCEYGHHADCKSHICECSCHRELPTTTRTETIWAIRMTEPVTGQELFRDVWVDSTRAARPSRPFVSAEDAASQLTIYSTRYTPTVVERKRVITEGPWTPVATGETK